MPFLSWIINVILGSILTCIVFSVLEFSGKSEQSLYFIPFLALGCVITSWPALIVEWIVYASIKRKNKSALDKRKKFFVFRIIFEASYLIIVLIVAYLINGNSSANSEKAISFFFGYFIPMIALHPIIYSVERFKTKNEIDKNLNSSEEILDDFL